MYFHFRSVLPSFEKGLQDPYLILCLFEQKKDSFELHYGKYASNQKRIAFLYAEFKDYFEVRLLWILSTRNSSVQSNESIINWISIKAVRAETKCQLPLLHIIPEPVSRISRYQLLIKDAGKEFAKVGDQENAELMEKARLLAADICMYCNNMADAGYITNFDVSILKKLRNFWKSCQFLLALVRSCQILSALVSSC